MVVRAENHLWQVLSSEFHMGSGQMGGLQHAKLKNLNTGVVVEKRFRPDEKLETVDVEKESLEFSYQDGDFYVFMNPQTYDQVSIHRELIGNKDRFLKEGLAVTGLFLEGQPLNLQFPESVELRVVTAPPPRREQETSTLKAVTLENGMQVLTPQFIKEGDLVRVDVETGKYVQRL